jgi:transposase
MHKGLSDYKIKKIMLYFCEDIAASKTASLLGINRNTINRYFNFFRQKIATFSREGNELFSDTFELDESYFGAKRIRGKRGRGAAGKTPVFGLLKRDGNVYVEIVESCSKASLMPIIQGKILEGSTIHTDGWKAYDGLILNGYDHYRVYHSKDEFARGKCHVNGIESFWSFAKRRLAKFNGLTNEKFFLHLKECEFRFNHRRSKNMLQILWKIWKS